MKDDTSPPSRIRDDDVFIVLEEVRQLMGGFSVSTAYDDKELMRLRVNMTSGERKTKCVRWIKREVLALRAERVARAEASAAANDTDVRDKIDARLARRRDKQRERRAKAAGLTTVVIKPRKIKLRPRTKLAEVDA